MRKTTISDFMSPHSASDKPFNVMGKFNPTTNKIELYPGAVADTLPTESTRAVVGEINPLTGDVVKNIVVLTQAQYDALTPPDEKTLYIIVED